MNMLLAILIFIITITLLLLPAIFYLLRWKYRLQKKRNKTDKINVAFLHPYCNAGGGGEKVLWVAIQTLQEK